MNRTGKSNAKKGPEEDYNAFKDFIDHETEAHIITRWMVFAGMTDMKGIASSRLTHSKFSLQLMCIKTGQTHTSNNYFSTSYPPITIDRTNSRMRVWLTQSCILHNKILTPFNIFW